MKSQTAELPLGSSSVAKGAPTALMLGGMLFVAFFDTFTQLPLTAPFAQALGAQGFWVGLIVGVYSVTNAVGNMMAGWLLDHVGRRLPLCLGFLGAGIAVALYGAAKSPGMLLSFRAIHGLVGGLLVPAVFTINADWTGQDERRKASGRIGMSIGMAALLGPLFGGVLGDRLGVAFVFGTVGALLVLAGIGSARWGFLDQRPDVLEGEHPPDNGDKKGLFAWSSQTLALATVSALLLTGCLGALTVLLPLELTAAGHPATATGAAFSAFAVTAMIVMLVGNRVADRAQQGIGIGFAAVSVAFFVLSLWPGMAGAVVAMGVFGAGFGLLFPTLNALVANGNKASARGRSYGLFYAGFSGGFIVAPPLAGWTADTLGSVWVFVGFTVLTLVAAVRLWRTSLQST